MKKKHLTIILLTLILLLASCKKSSTPKWAQGTWSMNTLGEELKFDVSKSEVKVTVLGESETFEDGEDDVKFSTENDVFKITKSGQTIEIKKKDNDTLTMHLPGWGDEELKRVKK